MGRYASRGGKKKKVARFGEKKKKGLRKKTKGLKRERRRSGEDLALPTAERSIGEQEKEDQKCIVK